MAQREALSRGDIRRLLFWSERRRATVLASPGTSLREDKELSAELEALRSVSRLLGEAEIAISRRTALERERRRLEAAVQARTRRSPGNHQPREGEFDLDMLIDELGDSSLIELIEVDRVLHAVIVAGRQVRLRTVGSVPDQDIQMNPFLLLPLARRPPSPGDEPAPAHRP